MSEHVHISTCPVCHQLVYVADGLGEIPRCECPRCACLTCGRVSCPGAPRFLGLCSKPKDSRTRSKEAWVGWDEEELRKELASSWTKGPKKDEP